MRIFDLRNALVVLKRLYLFESRLLKNENIKKTIKKIENERTFQMRLVSGELLFLLNAF